MLSLALTLIIAAVAYFTVTTLVNLYPLNDVRSAKRSEQITEVSVNGPLMALPAALLGVAAATSLPALGYVAGAIELVVAAGGLLLWWLPYLTGTAVPWATAGTDVSWTELHARTLIVLPRIGDHPRPNVEHMILHGLILAAAICTFAATAAL